MTARILITGFEPFDKSKFNPSAAIIERLSHPSVVAKAVLPVTFSTSATKLLELIDQHHPNVVIALGQAEGRTQIAPERVAINLDDARIPDNAGNTPKEMAIVADGPAAYFSTLPITEIARKLNESGIPAAVSLSAGTFVCNHIFYSLQNYCVNRDINSGFIHLPLMTEQAQEFPGLFTMGLEEMLRGINIVLDLLS